MSICINSQSSNSHSNRQCLHMQKVEWPKLREPQTLLSGSKQICFTFSLEQDTFIILESKQTWPVLQREIISLSSKAIHYISILLRHEEMWWVPWRTVSQQTSLYNFIVQTLFNSLLLIVKVEQILLSQIINNFLRVMYWVNQTFKVIVKFFKYFYLI